MRYIASLVGGAIGAAFFGFLGTNIIALPKSYLTFGMAVWFVIFGGIVFMSIKAPSKSS